MLSGGTVIDDGPQPEDAALQPQARADLVQLDRRQDQLPDQLGVDLRGVPPASGQPAADRRLPMAIDTHGGVHAQSLRQRTEHLTDPLRRCLELGERGVPPGTARGSAGLAEDVLKGVRGAVVPLADQRRHPCRGDPAVRAGR